MEGVNKLEIEERIDGNIKISFNRGDLLYDHSRSELINLLSQQLGLKFYDEKRYTSGGMVSTDNLAVLHEKEIVIPTKDAKKLLNITEEMKRKMKQTPTKEKYEEALKIVQQYEGRQRDLAKLNNDLGFCLQKFDTFKFDVNEDKGEVTFSGLTKSGELKLTNSKARSGDKFEDVIGKLIAVKKAIGGDVEYIERFVESERIGRTMYDYDYTGGLTVDDGVYTYTLGS